MIESLIAAVLGFLIISLVGAAAVWRYHVRTNRLTQDILRELRPQHPFPKVGRIPWSASPSESPANPETAPPGSFKEKPQEAHPEA